MKCGFRTAGIAACFTSAEADSMATIPNLNLNRAQLQQGYVLTASNGGHRDPTGGPTRFLNNPTLVEDYAHGAIGKTVQFAKAIIARVLRRPAELLVLCGVLEWRTRCVQCRRQVSRRIRRRGGRRPRSQRARSDFRAGSAPACCSHRPPRNSRRCIGRSWQPATLRMVSSTASSAIRPRATSTLPRSRARQAWTTTRA